MDILLSKGRGLVLRVYNFMHMYGGEGDATDVHVHKIVPEPYIIKQ
jgi:hypothetical protein